MRISGASSTVQLGTLLRSDCGRPFITRLYYRLLTEGVVRFIELPPFKAILGNQAPPAGESSADEVHCRPYFPANGDGKSDHLADQTPQVS